MKKQSSIDFLIKQLGIKKDGWNNSVIKQAKEMHKQEIIEAHESGVGCIDYGYGVEYYEETFKSE